MSFPMRFLSSVDTAPSLPLMYFAKGTILVLADGTTNGVSRQCLVNSTCISRFSWSDSTRKGSAKEDEGDY